MNNSDEVHLATQKMKWNELIFKVIDSPEIKKPTFA